MEYIFIFDISNPGLLVKRIYYGFCNKFLFDQLYFINANYIFVENPVNCNVISNLLKVWEIFRKFEDSFDSKLYVDIAEAGNGMQVEGWDAYPNVKPGSRLYCIICDRGADEATLTDGVVINSGNTRAIVMWPLCALVCGWRSGGPNTRDIDSVQTQMSSEK